MAVPEPSDILRGTLDLLILKAVAREPMHGWGISQHLTETSRDALQIGQGSLYPALQRLEHRGWLDSEWRATAQGRRAKYYRLTAAGRRALGAESASWRDYVRAIELVLKSS